MMHHHQPSNLLRAHTRRTLAPLAFVLAIASSAPAPNAFASDGDEPVAATTLREEGAAAANEAHAEGNNLTANAREYATLAREYAANGELGRALASLERARRLRPFNLELRQGIRTLNYQIQRARMDRFSSARLTQGEPAILWTWRLFHAFPGRAWAWLALAGVWCACAAYLLRRPIPKSLKRDAHTIALAFSTLVTLTSIACWIGGVLTSTSVKPGVLIGGSTTQVWSAPDPLVTPTLNPDAYDGAIVLVQTQEREWTEIQLADDERVWVRSEDVMLIEPQHDDKR